MVSHHYPIVADTHETDKPRVSLRFHNIHEWFCNGEGICVVCSGFNFVMLCCRTPKIRVYRHAA